MEPPVPEVSLKNDSGQTVLEFVLLLTVILMLSIMLTGGLNGRLAIRWKSLIEVISWPSDTPIVVR
ncbi:MAG: hypothetical protein DRQ88_02700 [Epsilonproteobacteria bacterium]|nr:MAG: hypothetical protein DRQ89_02155 [Campylobacterota bacterium]RLA67577.1 MAG: hypothetical protein DRQ88_02700 [Campylobacterota bacterium]